MEVGRWWARLDRVDAMLAVVTALHLLGAVTIAFAPTSQLINVGTRPAFQTLPRPVWAVLFLLGGVGALSLLVRVTVLRQLFAWFLCVPTQAMWAAASILAVLEGGGSAMAVVFLPAVLVWTCLTALFVGWDYLSGRR